MTIWTLARKDLRALLRDPKALIILLVMPLLFILVLGEPVPRPAGVKPPRKWGNDRAQLPAKPQPKRARAFR